MFIFYWAVAFLKYSSSGESISPDFYNANKKASIAFIIIFGAYAIIRFCFHKIAGLYMFKKLALAATLVGAVYDKHGYLAIVLGI